MKKFTPLIQIYICVCVVWLHSFRPCTLAYTQTLLPTTALYEQKALHVPEIACEF